MEGSAVGGLRHAPVANAEEPIGYREPFRSRSKIIMRSRVQDHHVSWYTERPLVVQRMSTGPSTDCETPFFRTIQMYARPSRDRSRCSERLSEVDRPRCRS